MNAENLKSPRIYEKKYKMQSLAAIVKV